MTFRGVVKDGVVVVEGLSDGTEVEILPLIIGGKKLRKPSKAFGLWANRKDLGKNPAKTLRKRVTRRKASR